MKSLSPKRPLGEILLRSGALAAARRLRGAALRRRALTILGYHRVSPVRLPLSPLTLHPREFELQIDYLAGRFDVWPLAKVRAWQGGAARLTRDTIVITFDDGYADNHEHAAPILERRGIPATFFVSTGPACRGDRFFWDVLRDHLAAAAAADAHRIACRAPEPIGRLLREYLAAAEAERGAGRALLGEMRRLPEAERAALLASLASARAGVAATNDARSAADHAESAALTREQIADLARRGFEIGAHGVTHASLPTLDPQRLREEVRGCLDDLRGCGVEATSFAYPYGDAGLPGGAEEGCLGEAGLTLAVTTEERPVRRNDAPLRLPRKVVPAQPLAIFAARLERLAWSR